LGFKSFTLAMIFAGNQAVIDRSLREAGTFGAARSLSIEEEQRFWNSVHAVTPKFLEKFRDAGAVLRISTTLSDCADALQSIEGPAHAHAASGIVRGWFTRPEALTRCMAEAGKRGWKAVVEFAADPVRTSTTLWNEPGGDFAIMKEIKKMFDPGNLLNRGRLYGQL
jgi:FAD/FMN-containing dehydrogenase